ncbi:MAG: hypothetical protein WCH76_02750 [Candidatus Riflemargulisbacteria bacterium]
MQIEKKPFGAVRIFSYFINALIFLILAIYFFDFVIKYFNFLNYFSPILIQYYAAMVPIDLIAFCFDFCIVYFLFSARKVISDRVLSGAGKLNAALLSAFFVYLLKFIFLNIFVYLKFMPLVNDLHFFLLYKAFFARLIVFFVVYLIYSMLLEYSKSVKWYFGNNYNGFYKFKDSFYFPFSKYLKFLGKIYLVILIFFAFLVLPIVLIEVKLIISLLFGLSSLYLLFFRKKLKLK